MAGLGFGLGGFSDSFQQGMRDNSLNDYRTQELKIQQQAQQNQQQRDMFARADKSRTELTGVISDTIEKLKIAGVPNDKISQNIQPLVQPLKRLTKSTGLDDSTIDAQIAAELAKPSPVETERKMALARDPYKSQLEAMTIEEKKANIDALHAGTRLESAASGASPASGTPPAGGPQSQPNQPQDQGGAFLSRLPPDVAQQVKDLAEYRTNPNIFPTRIAKGTTRSQREIMVGLAEQYAEAKGEQYDQTQFTARNKGVLQFAGGPEARATRSFNVLVDHLDVLKDATAALGNGDIQAFNAIKNAIATATGYPAPTDFNGVKSIVADELVKAVLGGAGALGDREQIDATVKGANSPQQLLSVIQRYQSLGGGQLSGLRQQYESTTGRKDFDKFLTPRTKKLFTTPSSEKSDSDTPGRVTVHGFTFTPSGQ